MGGGAQKGLLQGCYSCWHRTGCREPLHGVGGAPTGAAGLLLVVGLVEQLWLVLAGPLLVVEVLAIVLQQA